MGQLLCRFCIQCTLYEAYTTYKLFSSLRHLKGPREGGVCPVTGHVTRNMSGLIPALDCSQLLNLCAAQCKPSARHVTTPAPQVDSPRRTMSGKKPRGTHTGTRPPSTGGTGAPRPAVFRRNTENLLINAAEKRPLRRSQTSVRRSDLWPFQGCRLCAF